MDYRWTDEDRLDLEIKPIEQAETIPARWFTDPQLLSDEIDLILASSWQYLGHESQIPNPGDYRVDELFGKPLLTVRTQSGEIRCFANVCRHRGGPLADKHGSGRVLRCMYHAWTYNLEGTLIGAPKFEGVENFQKKDCTLPRYRLETYDGLMFVNLSGTAGPLSEHLGPIRETIEPIRLADMRYHTRVVYPVKANWKVYIDNYMEGYHLLPVHPELSRILDVSGYRTTVDQHRVLQYGPLAGEDNPYHTSGDAYYYHVFPNLMFNILPGRLQMNSILPVDADHCLTVFDFFFSEQDEAKRAERAKDDLAVSDLIQLEDIHICERVQKGLLSGAYNKGRICPSEELGVWAFQNNLRRAYGKLANGTGL